jgi:hypothetical protein
MTIKELNKKIKALGELKHEQKMSIICSLIGHSRISTTCWGYRNCARCREQLGDSLGSIDFGVKNAVIVGHKCDICKKNFDKCDWKDKLYCKDPFLSDEEYKEAPYLLEL